MGGQKANIHPMKNRETGQAEFIKRQPVSYSNYFRNPIFFAMTKAAS